MKFRDLARLQQVYEEEYVPSLTKAPRYDNNGNLIGYLQEQPTVEDFRQYLIQTEYDGETGTEDEFREAVEEWL